MRTDPDAPTTIEMAPPDHEHPSSSEVHLPRPSSTHANPLPSPAGGPSRSSLHSINQSNGLPSHDSSAALRQSALSSTSSVDLVDALYPPPPAHPSPVKSHHAFHPPISSSPTGPDPRVSLDSLPLPVSSPDVATPPDGQAADAYPYSHRSTLWNVGFLVTTCSAQFLAQAQFGAIIIPLVEIGHWLGTEDPGELSWMAASYGLTIGMFLVASGRLGDLFGPKLLLSLGYIVMIISNLGSAFCRSRIPFDICRALSGLGAAMALPNAAAMLARTFPPGQMRYIGFSILGALAPVGFWIGGAIAGAVAVKVSLPWVWYLFTLFAAAALILTLVLLPPDHASHRFGLGFPFAARPFDWLGTLLLVLSLGLFNFAWNQSAVTGWQETYVFVILIISLFSFVAFYLWERHMDTKALIPTEVLSRTSLLVYLSLWLGWMSLGTFLLYTTFFIRNIRGVSDPIHVALQLLPLAPLGAIAALIVPPLIVRLPGHVIFGLAMVAFFTGNLVASFTPSWQGYWGCTFVSEVLVIWGPDLSFATGSLIVANSVDRQFQGIAGGMVSMITNYSLSIGLGMAGTVERYVKGSNGTLLDGYRAAFYFATGLAGLATVVVLAFVRMEKQAHYSE